MDKYFRLQENGTNIKREVLAGITTFLTMAYIIAVNPSMLSQTGMPAGALVTATCLTAGITTIIMGLYANVPFGLASGMGLNAFFAFSVCIGMNVPWQVALAAVFVEGIIFIILSVTKVRESVVNCIPITMKHAVTAGIGCFIAFIGLVNAGIVVGNPDTLVGLGNFVSPKFIIGAIGVLIIAILNSKKIKGSMLWSILVCSILAWSFAIYNPEIAASNGIFLPDGFLKFESVKDIAFQLDFSYITSGDKTLILNFITILLTFLFVDFFDTVGTLVGVAAKANMLDENGNVPKAKKALLVDAIGTTFGALVGVSTVTTYVESAAGVAEGGRTGLTAVTVGVLFLLAMFLSPIFIAIPGCATAPCLIWIGSMMMESVSKINFSDFSDAMPAFITIIAMPLTYSIGDGLTLGVIFYTIINMFKNILSKKEDKKPISVVMYILTVLFILKLIFM